MGINEATGLPTPIDITKIKFKCNAIVAESIRQSDHHVVVVSHTCEGDINHDSEHCICKCGFYWKTQPKDSIGG